MKSPEGSPGFRYNRIRMPKLCRQDSDPVPQLAFLCVDFIVRWAFQVVTNVDSSSSKGDILPA